VPDNPDELRAQLQRNAQDFFCTFRISLTSFIGSESNQNQNVPFQQNNGDDGPIMPKFLNPVLDSPVSPIQQLRMLEHWASVLNTLPREMKVHLMEASKFNGLENFVDGIFSIENYINEWSSNTEHYKVPINNFFTSLIRLYEMGVLRNELFNPIYITQKLRDFANDSPKRNETSFGFGKDSLSDFKKAFSAPSLFNHPPNIKRNEPKAIDNFNLLGRSISHQSNVLNSPNRNNNNNNERYQQIKRDFENMEISESSTRHNQNPQNKFNISNLLCNN
jgi:hypothetical protein